jgi:DNA-binding MarR family transcriptional regulator
MTHLTEGLDDIVHQRTRLGILAVLAEVGRAQFGFLKETLHLSDGNLSRHLTILEEAGYAEIDKGYEGRRPRTWVRITKAGRRALGDEIALLKTLVRQFDGPVGDDVTDAPAPLAD